MSLKERLLEFAEKGIIKSFMIEFEDGVKIKMSEKCKYAKWKDSKTSSTKKEYKRKTVF